MSLNVNDPLSFRNMYWHMVKKKPKKQLFFFPGKGAWDRRMKEENRGNWVLVGTAVPSCKNQGRNKFIVSGETKVLYWEVFICILSHFCYSVLCF